MNIAIPTPLARTNGSSNMIYKGYVVTDEQQAAIDFNGSQKLEACAGSGKTSTLGAISSVLQGRGEKGLYIAFNKSIAEEAQRSMPSNVECRTAHSLAYRAKAIPFQNAGQLGKCYPNVIAREMNIQRIQPKTSTGVASDVLTTVTRFCYSNDETISSHHVPVADYKKAGYSNSEVNSIRGAILSNARKLWERMTNLKDRMPITHDVYLKLWALDKPRLTHDFLLFDEAQDANPVMTGLVLNQSAKAILVGDRYQQIYSWRGADNAMEKVDMQSHWLTKSFRFGQEIADIANHILNDQINAGVDIKGFEKITSSIKELTVENTNCIISRTNSDLIANVFDAMDNDKKVHVNGGVNQLVTLINNIERLKCGQRSEHPELCIFESYDQLVEYSESEQGQDMKLPIKLINLYGTNDLVSTLEECNTVASRADYTLTTAHKSKGLEWDNVRLSGDFRSMPDPKDPGDKAKSLWSPEEANLLYVAATRAKNTLDCSRVSDLEDKCQSSEAA